MTTANQMHNDEGLVLAGLDGSNPLAFLAALGTLRTLTHAWKDQKVRMEWRQIVGAWRPVLISQSQLSEQNILDAIHESLAKSHEVHTQLAQLGDDLSISPDIFREFAQRATAASTPDNRNCADYVAAFGNDMMTNGNGDIIQDTAFRTMAGAGHQHFLGFMRNICEATRIEHLQKSLFEHWQYDDPVEKLTMRWDPNDDTRYALQWRNPSGDPLRKSGGNMLGANRLAIEALPLFPTAPNGSRLATTGFRGRLSRNTFWTWPVWDAPISLDTIRSILAMPELQNDRPPRNELRLRGIVDVFRVQRLTIGKVRNFSPARSL